ncbi:MAG: protein phosphatase 2C domain-containing protein [Intrasporangium sp.]|uniref:PP2C family protein-serine/threonine phosphatase n=1 Tax=Intrasporangium sp. TaxID=1925024 RepID=UPI00264A3406|nr:protein phosphatase 2C domain-containing protein [Intrasporangium sp.]MDN5795273.1 protein phosphatase 2C domain-containing protein [Intrasporangium sp.]
MNFTVPGLLVGLTSHVGGRAHNEDAARSGRLVFVVADGMGGHAAGEVASGIAAETLLELDARTVLHPRDVVAQVEEANRRVLASAAHHPEQTGMGTTVAGLALVHLGRSPHWAVFNHGDSRVYRLLEGRLRQVTVDHSEVWELVQRGELTVEQARHHPGRNVVTRTLGRDPMAPLDTWLFPPYAGERFLICSDGLSNELTTEELEHILTRLEDAQQTADELVRCAVTRGARDNVTAIVVALPGEESGLEEDTTPREQVDRGAGSQG